MRRYEIVFIVHPEVDGDNLTAVIERVKQFVERDGGRVVEVKPWGTRRLAYPIQRQWEGQYVEMQVTLAPQGISTLERSLKLNEEIIRHLIVRSDAEVELAESSEDTAANEEQTAEEAAKE